MIKPIEVETAAVMALSDVLALIPQEVWDANHAETMPERIKDILDCSRLISTDRVAIRIGNRSELIILGVDAPFPPNSHLAGLRSTVKTPIGSFSSETLWPLDVDPAADEHTVIGSLYHLAERFREMADHLRKAMAR